MRRDGRNFRVIKGGGEKPDLPGHPPSLRIVEERAVKGHNPEDLVVPDFIPAEPLHSLPDAKKTQEAKAATVKTLQKYNTSLVDSEEILLESNNTNAIRLHAAFSFVIIFTKSGTIDYPMPEGDINQYIEQCIIDIENYDAKKAYARATVACGAIDMIEVILKRVLESSHGKTDKTVFDDFPSPTWYLLEEEKFEAQENVSNEIMQALYLADYVEKAEDETKEIALINYLQEVKWAIADSVGLEEVDQNPDGQLFLDSWRNA